MTVLLSLLSAFFILNKFHSLYKKYENYKMSIRINYINKSGKRTSTTISANIVDYYCHAVLKTTPTDEEKVKIINEFVRNGEYLHSKDDIEEELLSCIYYANPFEPCSSLDCP